MQRRTPTRLGPGARGALHLRLGAARGRRSSCGQWFSEAALVGPANRRTCSSADGGGDWDVYDAGRITSLPSDVAFHETWQYYPFACGDSVETGEVLGFAPYEWSRPPMFRSQFLEAFDMRTADEWSHHWRYLGRPSQNSVLVRREGEQCVYAVASCTCNEAG